MNVKWKQNVDSVKLKIVMPGKLRISLKMMYVIIVAIIARREMQFSIVLTYDVMVHNSVNDGASFSMQIATCSLDKLSYCPTKKVQLTKS